MVRAVRFTLENLTAAIALLVAAGLALMAMAQPSRSARAEAGLHRYDLRGQDCLFVVGGTGHDLHILVTGRAHCPGRIYLNGRRIIEQRAI